MRVTRLGAFAAIVVAACASPQQKCIQTAQAELQAIDQRIAEVEYALQRGYRQTPEIAPRTTLHLCAWPKEPVLFCTRHTPGRSATRVAVDLEAEETPLADLRERRVKVAALSAGRIATCATFQ